jgi:hypothetical protein
MLTDDDLLNFDPSRLSHYERGDGERRLQGEHADLYRNHLIAARWIDGWRTRIGEQTIPAEAPERRAGADYALREVVAHLRQGDFLPCGTLYEDEIAGRNEP